MRGVAVRPVVAVRGGTRDRASRALPEEMPVAVTVNGTTLAVMMASPADLEDFAIGLCLGEGVIAAPDEAEEVSILHHDRGIEARLWVPEARAEALAARRRAMAGPVGCGLCGIDSLEEAARAVPRVTADLRLDPDEVAGATAGLRARQPLHDRARAVHAAGLMRPGQGVVLAREDVGRHNALDKVIGAARRAGLPMAEMAAVLTSRVSVEMVQKSAMAGIPAIIAVSAPTTLALQVAEAAGITLVTSARGEGFDLWTHGDRIGEHADVV
ncbi:MAG: formate dehydrogenase accessory sulfurtransferase FdhD [Pseudooceanicola sp.]